MTRRDQLILKNMDWAFGLARERRAPRWLTEDLEGAALLGLCMAAGRYDPTLGVSFQKYAQARVRGEVKDECRRLACRPRGSPLDAPETEISETTLQIDFNHIPGPGTSARAHAREDVRELLVRTRGRQRRALAMMADGMTGRQAAAVLGVSPALVSILYKRGLVTRCAS